MSDQKTATSASDSPPSAGRETRSFDWLQTLQQFGLLFLLLIMVAIFSLLPSSSDVFPTVQNARTIVQSSSALMIVALAVIVPLIAGQFDLSVGANTGLCAIATAAMLGDANSSLLLAILVGVGMGAFVGLINGLLVAKVGVNSFITTLGTATIISGLILLYTEGQSLVENIPTTLTDVVTQKLPVTGMPRVLIVLIVVALAVWYLLDHTPFGRYLHAVGSSPSSARLVGIDVERVVLLSFVVGGALCGIAGVIALGKNGNANPTIGPTFLLPAFAAAFLGATMSKTASFNVLGTIVAVIFVAVSVSGFVLAGVEPWIEQTFNGTALVVAVALSTTIARHRLGRDAEATH